MSIEGAQEPTYTLYRRGLELLEDGDFEHATAPLAEAARRAPEKTSVREALGRAYFRAGRFAPAAAEFEAVVESHPVNDFAHFCLGRALSKTGQKRRARHHLALACNLRPERRDYRYYRRLLDAGLSRPRRWRRQGSADEGDYAAEFPRGGGDRR